MTTAAPHPDASSEFMRQLVDEHERWHAHPVAEVLRALHTREDRGLTASDAHLRLHALGPNELPQARTFSLTWAWWRAFLPAYALPLGAGIALCALDAWAEGALAILLGLFSAAANALAAHSASLALAELRAPIEASAHVLRDGVQVRVPARELVPGDVLLLTPGAYVPADVRLVEAAQLYIDETCVTGESAPAEKLAEIVLAREMPLAGRRNTAYLGSHVVRGHGKGVVIATGARAELARVPRSGDLDLPLPALIFTRIVWAWTVIALALVVLVLIWTSLPLLAGRAVAPAAVNAAARLAAVLAATIAPAGLPAALAAAATRAAHLVARTGVGVRRPGALDVLGRLAIILFSETELLTQKDWTLALLWAGGRPSAAGARRTAPALDLLVHLAVLGPGADASDSNLANAVSSAATGAGLAPAVVSETFPRLTHLAASGGRRYASTLHAMPFLPQALSQLLLGGAALLVVHGPTEAVLARCTHAVWEDCAVLLDPGRRRKLLAEADSLARRGLRVVACAYRPLLRTPEARTLVLAEDHLIFAGLLGFEAPPRLESAAALTLGRARGLSPVIVTQAEPDTARVLGERLGLYAEGQGQVLTGADCLALDGAALVRAVAAAPVIAGAGPVHAARLLAAWHAEGLPAALVSGTALDAALLQRAALGVAPGQSGAEAARQVADVVLCDDRCGALVAAATQARVMQTAVRVSLRVLLVGAAGCGVLAALGAPATGLLLALVLSAAVLGVPELAARQAPPVG